MRDIKLILSGLLCRKQSAVQSWEEHELRVECGTCLRGMCVRLICRVKYRHMSQAGHRGATVNCLLSNCSATSPRPPSPTITLPQLINVSHTILFIMFV